MIRNFSAEDIKTVAKGAGISLIGSSIGKGLFFLSQVIIARILGVEVFGLYALGFAAVKICEIIARLGLHYGGMRFVSIYKDDSPQKLKGVLVSATCITFLNGILIGLALYFSAPFIVQHFFKKPELLGYLQLFVYSIPFLATMTVVSSLLQGFHTMKYTVYTQELLQPLTNIILIAIFYYLGFHLDGVIIAFTISHLLALIAGIFYFIRIFPQFTNRNIKPVYEFKKLIAYSVPLLFVGFLNYFLLWTDTLMLGFLGTSKDVGIYRSASQLSLIMAFFLAVVTPMYASLAASLYHKGEMQRFANVFKTTTRWISYAVIPIFILILFSSREIMMLFGKGYVETGSMILIILSFGRLVDCMTGGVGYTLTMTGKQNIALIFSIGLVVINVVLNLFLIPRYGVLGAAIASSISVTYINLARLGAVYKIFKMQPFSGQIAKYIIPSIFSSLVILILNNLIGIKSGLFLNGTIIFLVFGSFYLFLIKNSEEDMFVIDTLKGKLSKFVNHSSL